MIHHNKFVEGVYCGSVIFRGTIVSYKPVSELQNGIFEFLIKCEKPIPIFGVERKTLCLHTDFYGQKIRNDEFADSWAEVD